MNKNRKMNNVKAPAVATAAICTLAVGALGAQAAASAQKDPQAQGRVTVAKSADYLPSYSDRELLEFLVAGQGPVAVEHPELLTYLGFSADKPTTPQKSLNGFMKDYLVADPDFHTSVAVPMQSGDPATVNAALRQFSKELRAVVEDKVNSQPASKAHANNAQAAGWTWRGANIAVYANAVAVANAGVYANVGVATFVGAVLAIWYLEDGSMTGTEIEMDTFVSRVADALAS